MRNLIVGALLSSTALIPTASIAETENQAAPAASSAATTPQGQVNAEQFVHEAAISDMFEIQSSQLAGQKSQDQQVKQFANEVTQDHTKASNELKSAAQEAKNVQVPNALDQEHKEKLQQLQQATHILLVLRLDLHCTAGPACRIREVAGAFRRP